MLIQANEILQIAIATLLALGCILLIRHAKSGQHSWTGIAFIVSILCYVIVESSIVQSLPALRTVVILGAICTPILFWLLSRAIFDDHFKFVPSIIWFFILQIIPHFNFFICGLISWPSFARVSAVAAGFTSFGFVLAGLYTAWRTKQSDLIDSRLRFRNIFITITATLIGLTLIGESVPIDHETTLFLQVLQRFSIFVLTLYFLISNFEIRSGFFFREIPKPKAQPFEDRLLNEKLQSLMNNQNIYKKEGLTIRELATLLNEQEYRLRKLINGQLGFRNFNDFLNQYRINDACEILSDPTQARKTILEIAYDLGYQSIGPFNKAFKDLKGVTPTAYRKSQFD